MTDTNKKTDPQLEAMRARLREGSEIAIDNEELVPAEHGFDYLPVAQKAAEQSGYFEVPRKQVGGDHYVKRAIQPFDIIDEYRLDFFEGNALKYLLRWKDKNGIEDLEKARHYLEEIIERAKRGA